MKTKKKTLLSNENVKEGIDDFHSQRVIFAIFLKKNDGQVYGNIAWDIFQTFTFLCIIWNSFFLKKNGFGERKMVVQKKCKLTT